MAAADFFKLKVRVIDFYDAVAAEDDVAFGDDENGVPIREKCTATCPGLGLPFAKIFERKLRGRGRWRGGRGGGRLPVPHLWACHAVF